MSLESALDEEAREVMALLEGRPTPSQVLANNSKQRAASPTGAAKSPVRSMLDVGPSPPSGRHASIAGSGVGITSPRSPRSMLDVGPSRSPPPSGSRATFGSPLSSPRFNPEESYQFEMLPTIESHSMPKRVTMGGKKGKALAGVFGPQEGERQRQGPTSGYLGKKNQSVSPAPRTFDRSQSPGGRKLNSNSLNLMSDPKKYVSESGKVFDMSSAYRRLSDAALLKSGGSLSKLPTRKGSDPVKGESVAPDGGVRLEKDYAADSEAVESSDEGGSQSSGEDEWGSEKRRGRNRTRQEIDPNKIDIDGKRTPKSLLAAAEDERKTTAYKYRSLLEPSISVTTPEGEKTHPKKTGVHPNTSFDQGGSGISTPVDSDAEADISEIRSAQRLDMRVSAVHSTPEAHRCVRQIIRGDYARLQKEAEQGLRRQRMYLVATDLSDEAAYALEWTIGTVLRDGDTLLAVYAVDEEVGTGGDVGGSINIGEGAKAMQDMASVVKSLSNEDMADSVGNASGTPSKGHKRSSSGISPSPLHQVEGAESEGRSSLHYQEGTQPDLASMDKPERERWHAVLEVSERCIKLLRKTKLQIRVVVEVFHCKSPKHMLTEVIDFLEPTLVILGSRGRSALKGVLLGSFSNYLVTKSSIPVMVARKRLRKHSKYKRTNLRLSNVLTNPTSKLAMAKID